MFQNHIKSPRPEEDFPYTIPYSPPEFVLENLQNKQHSSQTFEKYDEWSCGIILYCLLKKEYPSVYCSWLCDQSLELGEVFEPFGYRYLDELLSHLLTVDPSQRFSIEEALRLPIFTRNIEIQNGIAMIKPDNSRFDPILNNERAADISFFDQNPNS